MNNCLDKKVYNGVTYHYTTSTRYRRCSIMNIDIEPGITTLDLRDFPDICLDNTEYLLRDVKKQFPEITKLIVHAKVNYIDISNFMFPNVQEVVSLNTRFLNGSVLIEKHYNNIEILNTFCKQHGEIIDLKNANGLANYAMEGCMASHFVNADKIMLSHYQKAPYAGAIFTMNPKKYLTDSIFLVGRNVACIDEDADILNIPNNILGFAKNLDFSHVKNVAIRDVCVVKHFFGITTCKSVFLKINDRIDFSKLVDFRGIKNIQISEENPYYCIMDGLVYSKDKKTLIFCPKGKQGDVIIPEGVEYILHDAFYGCIDINSVTLPNSLKHVGTRAFSDCCALKKITFGTGLQAINEEMLSGCNGLEEVDIPSQVKVIESAAFRNCRDLHTVILHEGMQELQNSAFEGCISLKTIKLPSTVRSLHIHSLPVQIEEIFVTSDYPKNLIASFMLNVDFAIDKFCVIHIENYGDVYIPSDISNVDVQYINDQFDLHHLEKSYTDTLYELIRSSFCKQSVAIKIYKITHNEEIGKYLRRVGKSIASRLIKQKNEELLVSFLELGLMTSKALQGILPKAKEANMTITVAYILKSISESDGTTSFKL